MTPDEFLLSLMLVILGFCVYWLISTLIVGNFPKPFDFVDDKNLTIICAPATLPIGILYHLIYLILWMGNEILKFITLLFKDVWRYI